MESPFKQQRVTPKIFINIGATFDIPVGSIVTGMKGESIINGGLGQIDGLAGAGNNFKSTIEYYKQLSAADKIYGVKNTLMYTYDTEMNISLDRLNNFARKFNNIPENPTTDGGVWDVVDKSTMPGNKWAIGIDKFMADKTKDKKNMMVFECFKDPYTGKELEKPIPTFTGIDSFSEFDSEATAEMLDNDLDSSDTNTYAMKQGLFKSKFFQKLPAAATRSNNYFLVTAHIGQKIDMATGPAKYNQPTKELQHIKGADVLKGVTKKFNYLTTVAWFAHTATVLQNKTTKLAEYPLKGIDGTEKDLNVVRLTPMRNKNGQSGFTLHIVVSQTEGVLPTLTEFHNIKENGRFGLNGSNISYEIDLYPGCKLGRTTVRTKINEDPKLRRAINITSEMHQLFKFHPFLEQEGLACTPEELYKDIKELGYDWDLILGGTRGYFLPDQYTNKLPFLSTVDLLKMRKGLYHPYFLDDKKQLKKYYVKDKK